MSYFHYVYLIFHKSHRWSLRAELACSSTWWSNLVQPVVSDVQSSVLINHLQHPMSGNVISELVSSLNIAPLLSVSFVKWEHAMNTKKHLFCPSDSAVRGSQRTPSLLSNLFLWDHPHSIPWWGFTMWLGFFDIDLLAYFKNYKLLLSITFRGNPAAVHTLLTHGLKWSFVLEYLWPGSNMYLLAYV